MKKTWHYVEPVGNWQLLPSQREENMSEKIGAGHAEAMLRAGAKELAQILPAFPDSVRPVEEPGLVGNLTPSEVVDTKESAFFARLDASAESAPAQELEDVDER